MWRPRRPPSVPLGIATPKSRTIPLLPGNMAAATSPPTRPYFPDTLTYSHILPPTYFLPSTPRGLSTSTSPESESDHKQPDERTIQLGRTIRTLQERMPTLLHSPLPTEILSPSISLHLFPTTHPHLPVVRGRVAYIAAMWTAPIAWRRLPGGNTKLVVISERMLEGEKFRIRWRAGSDEGEFSGIFLFEFDEMGRVSKHVIENSEEDDGERLPGVISFTEWLLRKAKGEPTSSGGGLAWQFERIHERR